MSLLNQEGPQNMNHDPVGASMDVQKYRDLLKQVLRKGDQMGLRFHSSTPIDASDIINANRDERATDVLGQ